MKFSTPVFGPLFERRRSSDDSLFNETSFVKWVEEFSSPEGLGKMGMCTEGLEYEERKYSDRTDYVINVLFYKKEDIRVSIDLDKNVFVVSGKRSSNDEKRDYIVSRKSISSTNKFSFTKSLDGFDSQNVKATYENGLLVVSLFPEKNIKQTKGTIPVEITSAE